MKGRLQRSNCLLVIMQKMLGIRSVKSNRKVNLIEKQIYTLSSLLLIAAPVSAESFVVPGASGQQTVSSQDTGTINAGATLTGGKPVIEWNGNATGKGIVITNKGTIDGDKGRAIDTSNNASGAFQLDNTGTITSSKSDAIRINNPFENGSFTINNSGVIVSGGGQALDFDSATSNTAKITINNNGGTIQSSSSDAIRLGAGTIDITNSGTIKSTSSGDRAISFDTDSNFDTLKSLTLTNQAGGVIEGSDDALKIKSTANSTGSAIVNIDNAGTITSSKKGQALDLADITSTNAQVTITNRAGATISAANNNAIKGGKNTTINNSGTISSSYADGDASSQNNSAIRIDGGDTGAFNATITNQSSGVISGAYHGIKASGLEDNLTVINQAGGTIIGKNGSGVNSNGTGTVTNYGEITGSFDNAATFGDGDGIDFDKAGTINNYGTIKGLGSKGVKDGETKTSTSEAIAIGGGTIINGTADNTSALISGANNGILDDNSANGDAFEALSVTNYGTITGLDGFGIKMVNSAGTFANTIINYGSITGTNFAVAMGNGDDTFVYQDGSSVTGNVDAEGGTDTFKLGEKSGTFDLSLLGNTATYQNFELLTFASDSTWTLSGQSDFSGNTNITDSASVTLNNASLASSSVSLTNGTLTGTGTVGSTVINNGGILAPGSSATPSTLNIKGTADFKSGSTYLIYVTPPNNVSQLTATDEISIDSGAKVTIKAQNATYEKNKSYEIMRSDVGITGKFSNKIDTDAAFLKPVLDYQNKQINLTLVYDDGSSFVSYADTPNQKSTASAIQSLGQNNPVFDAFIALKKADVATAYNAVSGEAQASTSSAITQQTSSLRTVVNTRIAARASSGRSSSSIAERRLRALSHIQLAYAEQVDYAQQVAYGQEKLHPKPINVFALANNLEKAPPSSSFWVQTYGGWNHTNGQTNAADIKSRVGGVVIGTDRMISKRTRLGVFTGYSQSTYDVDARSSSGKIHTYDVGTYASTGWGAWSVNGTLAYSLHHVNSTRHVIFSGFDENIKGDYHSGSFQTFGETRYRFTFSDVKIEPFLSAAYVHTGSANFTETGGSSALKVYDPQDDNYYTTLGSRLFNTTSFNEHNLTSYLTLGWQHAYGNLSSSSTMRFANSTAGSSFQVYGPAADRNTALLNVGFDYGLSKRSSITLDYGGKFSSHSTNTVISGKFSMAF